MYPCSQIGYLVAGVFVFSPVQETKRLDVRCPQAGPFFRCSGKPSLHVCETIVAISAVTSCFGRGIWLSWCGFGVIRSGLYLTSKQSTCMTMSWRQLADVQVCGGRQISALQRSSISHGLIGWSWG